MHVVFLLLLLCAAPATAQRAAPPAPQRGEWSRVLDLRGPWRFHVGDDPIRSWVAFDDAAWETILVPSRWEDEGFWGYDGVAWYRRTFTLAEADLRAPLYLRFGRIDDADEVWVNGRFVGSTGRFPASGFETAHFTPRAYRIPPGFLRPGRNVVAVRVFDEHLDGGVLDGPVGLFTRADEPPLALDLAGTWQFHPFRPAPTAAAWDEITVPAKWEPQGYATLDNFAWYRRTFPLSDRLRRERLVLVLGRVDDLHEVHVNGERIGGTPGIDERAVRGSEWQQLRAYPLPAEILRAKNEVVVRVFDGGYEGGIYDGPVGIMTADDFDRWQSGGGVIEKLKALFKLGG